MRPCSTENGSVELSVGGLTEEVGQRAAAFLRLFDDAVLWQYGLTLANVPSDPQNLAVRLTLLSEEFVIVENLLVRIFEKAAFCMLNEYHFFAGIGRRRVARQPLRLGSA